MSVNQDRKDKVRITITPNDLKDIIRSYYNLDDTEEVYFNIETDCSYFDTQLNYQYQLTGATFYKYFDHQAVTNAKIESHKEMRK